MGLLDDEESDLRMERDLLKRTVAFWERNLDAVMRYCCVDAQKPAGFPVPAAR